MSTTYFCPRGCNVCDERAIHVTGLECGSCGSIMTTDSTRYDEVHQRIEDEGIAACERETLIDQLKSVTKDWTFDDDISKPQERKCIEIGKQLNDLGGFPLMSKAYYAATEQNRSASTIRILWHGIGEWQM